MDEDPLVGSYSWHGRDSLVHENGRHSYPHILEELADSCNPRFCFPAIEIIDCLYCTVTIVSLY